MNSIEIYNKEWKDYLEKNKLHLLLELGSGLAKFLLESDIVDVTELDYDYGYRPMQLYRIHLLYQGEICAVMKGNASFRTHQKAYEWGFKAIHKEIQPITDTETEILGTIFEPMNFERLCYTLRCERESKPLVTIDEVGEAKNEYGEVVQTDTNTFYYVEGEEELLTLYKKNGVPLDISENGTFVIYENEQYRMSYHIQFEYP